MRDLPSRPSYARARGRDTPESNPEPGGGPTCYNLTHRQMRTADSPEVRMRASEILAGNELRAYGLPHGLEVPE